MKTILFRDKTAALDLTTVVAKTFWDNTAPAKQMVSGDTVFITPTRSNYKTNAEWLNASAIWGYALVDDAQKLEMEENIWPSGKGGYCHRHYLHSPMSILVKDIAWLDPEAFEALLDWKQGAVRYVHSEGGIFIPVE